MRQTTALRALFSVALFSVASGSAFAQSRDEIREQNEQLYQQYQQSGLGDQSSGMAPPSATGASSAAPGMPGNGPNLLAQLLDRVSRLEEQNRELSGRVDELTRDLQTQTAQLNKQIGDLTFAVQQGGGHPPGADATAAAPAAAAPAPVAAPPPRVAPHAPRIAAAPSEPATPPPGPRGAGMAYQLAREASAHGNYRQAALAYYDVYNRAPHGPLAADALVHVSASMAALGQNGAACEALAKFHAEFPGAKGAVAHQASAIRTHAHC